MPGSGSSGQRAGAAGIVVVTAVLGLFFVDVLLGASSFHIRDLVYGAYPSKTMLRETVLAGDFPPQWNRWLGAGQPMAANPAHQVFYPPTWLILLPDFLWGFNFLLLLHLFIGAWGAYALLRSMDAGVPASVVAGVSFALCVVLAVHDLFPLILTLAWLPWTCLFARRWLRGGTRRDLALAALFLGIEVLLGEIAVVLQTGTILGFYALKYRGRGVAKVALLCVVAVLIAAVQLLPTIDHARDSVRARGFDYERVVSWSMPAARIGELLNPNLLGYQMLNGRPVYWGSPLYGERGLPFVRNLYPGLLLTALAIAGVIAGVRGRSVFGIVGALSLLLALGAQTPLWRALYESGLARSIRYPEKFILMGLFVLIVFGAKVLDRLLQGDEGVLRAARRTTAALAILLGAIALFSLTGLYAPLFVQLWNPSARVFGEMLPASRSAWLLAAGKGALLFILVRNLTRTRRPLWLALAGVLVLLDLGMLVPELAPRVPRAFFDDAPQVAREFQSRHRDCRLFHAAAWERAGAYQSQQPDLYWIHRNALYPMMPGAWGIATAIDPDLERTSLLATTEFNEAALPASRTHLDNVAAMAGVCAVAVHEDWRAAFARVGGDRTRVQPVRLLHLPPAPRYAFAERLTPTADFATPRAAFVRGLSFTPARGRVLAVHETPSTARIDVEAEGEAYLMMSVTPHKYWRVTVDGKPAQAHVTNIGFQGVVVPKGRHRVEMAYRNPLFAIGGAVSLATLAALALAGWRSR
jgi:Bacterial membrane protein YfhO